MIDHDRLFKELLSNFFPEFVDLFLPDVIAYLKRDDLRFLNQEIFTDVTSGERYEADLTSFAEFPVLVVFDRSGMDSGYFYPFDGGKNNNLPPRGIMVEPC